MSETNTPPEDNAAKPEGQPDPATLPSIRTLDRYVKDLSFENPNSPMSLNPALPNPAMEAQVGVGFRQLGPEQFEVELSCTVTAKHGDNIAFVIEVNYGGLFVLQNMTQEMSERALLVDCPQIMFPYMRHIIAEATRSGGFSPLTMQAVNFVELYEKQKADAKANPQGAAASTPTDNPA